MKKKTGSLQTIVCLQTPGLNLKAEPDVSDLHDSLQGGYVTKRSLTLCLESSCENSDNLLLGNQTLLHFNLYINTRWEVERRERVDRLWIWVQDINDTLMNPHLKLFTRVFMDKGRAVDRPLLLFSRKRHGTDHTNSTALRGFDNHLRRLVDDLVIIGADLDPHAMGRRCRRFGVCHENDRRAPSSPAPSPDHHDPREGRNSAQGNSPA